MAELIRKGVYLLGEVQSISQCVSGVKCLPLASPNPHACDCGRVALLPTYCSNPGEHLMVEEVLEPRFPSHRSDGYWPR